MDDQMMDLMAGDDLVRRRLEAYADLRLSPDLTTSSRLRARVLAVAHRHASLARADAALTLLSRADEVTGAERSDNVTVGAGPAPTRPRRERWHRVAGVLFAASLAAVMLVGGVSAARPGGPLYDTRLWVEVLILPSDPSARAVAELDRLGERLREIAEANRSGDTAAVMVALSAYEAIVEQASASAILAGDDVAAAALETGVGRNVEVLRALAATVPTNASAAIGRAVDAAIARSTDALARIGASRPGGGPGDGAGAGPASPPRATKQPTAEPRPPRATPATTATPKPKPTHRQTPKPTPTPEPSATPDRTSKPRLNQSQVQVAPSPETQLSGDAQDEDD
jgi:hypothetical protein